MIGRSALRWVLLAILGLVVTVGASSLAASLTSQQIGLSSESYDVGKVLAPPKHRDEPAPKTEQPRPHKKQKKPEPSEVTTTATPAVAPPTVATPVAPTPAPTPTPDPIPSAPETSTSTIQSSPPETQSGGSHPGGHEPEPNDDGTEAAGRERASSAFEERCDTAVDPGRRALAKQWALEESGVGWVSHVAGFDEDLGDVREP
ncbi:hypothetical protein BH10ACT11_BH10ACT11_20370 [soil metagenome]